MGLGLKESILLELDPMRTKRTLSDGNQVEDAQAHEAQAQQGAQAQRITRSMARALGQEYQKMTLLISIV